MTTTRWRGSGESIDGPDVELGADGGQSFESIPFEIRHDRKTFILDLDLGARVTLDQAADRC